MKKIAIFCDSCSSLSLKKAQELDVKIIPTLFYINDEEINPFDENVMDYEEYYLRLENKESVKTSCINPNVFINQFTPYLEDGYDILYIALSKGLSASYNNAYLAKTMLEDEYDSNIEVINSKTGSVGIMHTIYEACRLRDENKSVKEIKELIDDNKLKVTSLFTIGSLDHLRRGGRLSLVSAVVATLLKINPVVATDDEGKLVVDSKHRGRKSAVKYLLNKILECADKAKKIFIGHTNCKEEAANLKKEIESNGYVVEMDYIDHTMGAHCGPRTLAIFYQNI